MFQIHRLEYREFLAGLEPESVDLLITDIPYESLEKHRSRGTTTRLSYSKSSSNDWFRVIPNRELADLMARVYRVMKDRTHVYMFSDFETSRHLVPAGEAAGFKFWKPIVWDKRHIGMGYHYRARYELVLFFEKAKSRGRRLNNLGISDIIEVPRISRGRPAEKPPEVAKVLIEQSSQPGELVVDPFCGSGSTGVAALLTGRSFLGNDISQDNVDYATDRLTEVMKCL